MNFLSEAQTFPFSLYTRFGISLREPPLAKLLYNCSDMGSKSAMTITSIAGIFSMRLKASAVAW